MAREVYSRRSVIFDRTTEISIAVFGVVITFAMLVAYGRIVEIASCARRAGWKGGGGSVPTLCLLDPDGDIVRQLRRKGRARRHDGWVCYRTDLHLFVDSGLTIDIVESAVEAVPMAEELFASGCELLSASPRPDWSRPPGRRA